MSKMVNIDLDGKSVSVPEGLTLVDAAATVDVHIPNLCHIKELRGIGACRMCMVEIEGMKAPVTACTTKVKEGMKVSTRTPKVEEIRKFVVDLVLSFHPLDCMTCPKAGACDLQQYAADLGIKESSFGRKSFQYELNDKSPFITIDSNYCVLCGRCVRVCKEQGTNVLEFMGRGIKTRISTALDRPLHESGCTFCGSCVDACPVNSIMERDRWQHGREWDLEKHESVCTVCGSGCSVKVSKRNGRIVKVNAKEENGYICAVGRFGFDSLYSSNRVTSPMRRQDNTLVPITWDEAVRIASQALAGAGADAGFIASGSLTNEEAFAVQTLARDVVGSANIDTPVSHYSSGMITALRSVFGNAGTNVASVADLSSADLVVVIGADPSQKKQSLQEVNVMIRRKAQAGAKIIVINPDQTGLAAHQNALHLELRSGADSVLLAGLMTAVLAEGTAAPRKGFDALKKSLVSLDKAAGESGVPVEKITEAAKMFASAKHPVIIFGTGVSADEHACLQILNLALLKNAGIIPLMIESNALGVMAMGCLPDSGPGFSKAKGNGKSYAAMKSGTKALYIAGPVPDLDFKTDFLIVQASHHTALTGKADLVFPAAVLYEKQGTIMNTYGTLKVFGSAEKTARDVVETIAGISAAMGGRKKISAFTNATLAKNIKFRALEEGSFRPAPAKTAEPYAASTTVLLMALNQGMLSNSGVARVLVVNEPVLQE